VDLVHVLSTAGYGLFRSALHIAIARAYGVPSVFHLLGQFDDMYREAGEPMRLAMRRSFDVATAHIVQSPGLAEFLRPLTCRPVYAVFNGVQETGDPPRRPRNGERAAVLEVVTLGTLGHKKGTFDLLDAAARLHAEGFKAHVTFIGGGEVERFRELARARGLDGYVDFVGLVDDAVRVRLMRDADVFVLPSRREGQPLALLEAMEMGLPVIASSVGSIPEVVGPDNGFLVKPGDVEALAAHLRTLAGDAQLRETLGRRNAAVAKQRYTITEMVRNIDAVYQLVARPG
jgi:glycosyltransferase involved in cell wall biosynthesis